MRRTILLASLTATLAAAFALYDLKYDTRRLQRHVHETERRIERTERDIIVLQAERAHAMRPERIEALARARGLRPAAPGQFGSIGELPLRRHPLAGSGRGFGSGQSAGAGDMTGRR